MQPIVSVKNCQKFELQHFQMYCLKSEMTRLVASNIVKSVHFLVIDISPCYCCSTAVCWMTGIYSASSIPVVVPSVLVQRLAG